MQPRTTIAIALCAAALAATGCAGSPASQPTAPASETSEAAPATTTAATEATATPERSATMSLSARLEAQDYKTWVPATGYEQPQPAKGPHGDKVRIVWNDTARKGWEASMLSSTSGPHSWPEDSIIVKKVYVDGAIEMIAAMEKRGDAWYWGEWTAEGETIVEEGLATEPCESCHAKDSTDGTLGIRLAE